MKAALLKELDKILPVVVRVHGDHHPELKEVETLYPRLREGDKEAFQALRKITNDYTVPADACPTYAKTYADLKLLEEV